MDDTLIAETRCHVPTDMSASIEVLYVVLDCKKISERRSLISMDKFAIHKRSLENQQLGMVINTCTMNIIFLKDKLLRLVTTLNTN